MWACSTYSVYTITNKRYLCQKTTANRVEVKKHVLKFYKQYSKTLLECNSFMIRIKILSEEDTAKKLKQENEVQNRTIQTIHFITRV
jgi:hypothetical protein